MPYFENTDDDSIFDDPHRRLPNEKQIQQKTLALGDLYVICRRFADLRS